MSALERTAVIGLGAGVQSSALLLMAARGELAGYDPKLAVFADTGDEPQEVYDWLAFLEEEVAGRVEVVRTSLGTPLGADVVAHARGEVDRVSTPPFFVRGDDGRASILGRSCTRDYKVVPVKRLLRERGFGPKRPVVQLLGITLDEIERMKPSREKWQQLAWPLVEMRLTRHDCLLWMERNGYPRPPRSACTFCPFRSPAEWRRMRDEQPAEWDAAVEFDLRVRHLPSVESEVFLNRQLVPLSEMDLSTVEDRGQMSLHCDGLCDV